MTRWQWPERGGMLEVGAIVENDGQLDVIVSLTREHVT